MHFQLEGCAFVFDAAVACLAACDDHCLILWDAAGSSCQESCNSEAQGTEEAGI